MDSCNNINSSSPDEVATFNLHEDFRKLHFGVYKAFKKGEEYGYNYVDNAGNNKLLQSYGFYINDNIYSDTYINIKTVKASFSLEKYKLAVELKLIENSYEVFYKSTQDSILIPFTLDKNKLSAKLSNYIKIYLSDDNDLQKYKKMLAENKWISYDNQLISLGVINNLLTQLTAKGTFSYRMILSSLVITRNYFKKNRESIVNNKPLRYKYRMRRKIMEVSRENFETMTKNKIFCIKEFRQLQNDQLRKLKRFYLNN